jgi:hypothetical protein
MSVSEYAPVTWSDGDGMDTVKLQQMVDNTRILYENTPSMQINSHGVVKESGLRIFATTVQMPTSSENNVKKTIYFGNFFSPGCKPIVTIGFNVNVHKKMYANFNGLSDTHWVDHRGMDIFCRSEMAVGFKFPTNVNVIAIGW